MASTYYMILVITILFVTIHSWESKKKCVYKGYSCIFWYVITRGSVILATPKKIGDIWECIAVDFVLFCILFGVFYFKKQGSNQSYESVISYLFWPGNMICIASGGVWEAIYTCTVVLVLFFIMFFKLRHNNKLEDFYEEYLLSAAAVWILCYSNGVLGQNVNDLWNKQDDFPMLLILGIIIFLVVIIKIIMHKENKGVNESKGYIDKEDVLEVVEGTGLKRENINVTIEDIFIMSAGTILFLGLALFRLGASSVPTSEVHMETGKSSEVILDFGQEINISRVEFFLGYKEKRIVSFSIPENGEWKVIKSRQELKSVFCWNEVSIDSTQRYLACKFLDQEAYVREMVCFDDKGRKVIPKNASEYKKLFDEQSLYPENETYYYRTMFDEVYHGRTAYEFLHKLPIYENTHPPLGKIIISIGIAVFGMNPFGWRFMGVICGTLILPVIYLFALRLTGKTKFASLALILVLTEFMHFTLSRIATLDIIAALFIILLFYFMYAFIQTEKVAYLILDGIVSGIAMAVKWNGVYAVAGIAVIFAMWCYEQYSTVKHGREYKRYWCRLCGVCVGSFIIIPVCIYVLSYIPFARVYTDKNIIMHAIDNSKLMLSYHKSTVFEHPYSSEWYEWIWDRKSLLDALTVNNDGSVSSVATFAGPLVCWGGLIALVYQIYLWSIRKDNSAKFIVMAYASALVPWMFIHRTVFIYHYLPCLNILSLMIVYSIYKIKSKRENCYITIIAVTAFVLFAAFYPVLSGMKVPREYLNIVLEWLPGWRFV